MEQNLQYIDIEESRKMIKSKKIFVFLVSGILLCCYVQKKLLGISIELDEKQLVKLKGEIQIWNQTEHRLLGGTFTTIEPGEKKVLDKDVEILLHAPWTGYHKVFVITLCEAGMKKKDCLPENSKDILKIRVRRPDSWREMFQPLKTKILKKTGVFNGVTVLVKASKVELVIGLRGYIPFMGESLRKAREIAKKSYEERRKKKRYTYPKEKRELADRMLTGKASRKEFTDAAEIFGLTKISKVAIFKKAKEILEKSKRHLGNHSRKMIDRAEEIMEGKEMTDQDAYTFRMKWDPIEDFDEFFKGRAPEDVAKKKR